MGSQDERRRQIETAAFKVLAKKGYRSASMLQIAKQAKASNETMYAWYTNKQTLFKTIIEENGKAVRSLLEDALSRDDDPLRTLRDLGPLLLRFTTDSKAIVMNRAAVIDATETGVLAKAIDEVARGVVYPLICSLMQRLQQTGHFHLDAGASYARVNEADTRDTDAGVANANDAGANDADTSDVGTTSEAEASEAAASDAADSYVALLFGEVQLRQAFGTLEPLSETEIERRAARAYALTCRLYARHSGTSPRLHP